MATGDHDSTAAETSSTEPADADQTPPTPGDSSDNANQDEKQPAPLARVARGRGPLAARGLGVAKPASPSVSTVAPTKNEHEQTKQQQPDSKPKTKRKQKNPPEAPVSDEAAATTSAPKRSTKVAVPNRRAALPDDIQAELDAELAAADVESMLGGSAGMADRKEPLAEGARVHAQVLKIHDDMVFVALGGPDEGAVPFEQFEQEPAVGSAVEVIVRSLSSDDGLYLCSRPGSTIEVTDWEDLEEGSVVVATVTGSNSGGLECKVGGVRGFIPISQISEYRVEDTSEYVDQKLTCVVTEANQRRGNLVLSRRAVLERQREEKRKEQLEKLEPGVELEGVVRSLKDFGAFVDLGGVDGLIHISKMSWDRVQHPSEVLEEGQKVKVKIDTIDKQKGKIGLSYRDTLINPWDTAEAEFGVGSVHQGTVTKIAPFGCFVKLAPGVEGLVHISELAHHRVSKVDSVVSEGDQVEVKVLSFDRDAQKIGLSMKAAQQPAADTKPSEHAEDPAEPLREPEVKPSHAGPLKGGNNRETGGERFGLRW